MRGSLPAVCLLIPAGVGNEETVARTPEPDGRRSGEFPSPLVLPPPWPLSSSICRRAGAHPSPHLPHDLSRQKVKSGSGRHAPPPRPRRRRHAGPTLTRSPHGSEPGSCLSMPKDFIKTPFVSPQVFKSPTAQPPRAPPQPVSPSALLGPGLAARERAHLATAPTPSAESRPVRFCC